MTLRRLLTIVLWITSGVVSAQMQRPSFPLWRGGAPEASAGGATEHDMTSASDALVAGRKVIRLTDVSEPSVTLYAANAMHNSKAAVVVFPGGGYKVLAWDLEGTEVCVWLNSLSVNCVLVKYRVPYDGHYPEHTEDLEDAQQAMRMTRAHADAWGIDPRRVGVLGFSAGAHLAAVLSNHFDEAPNAAAVKGHGGLGGELSARPDFALLIYPGYLDVWPNPKALAPEAVPHLGVTPPTFLVQAADDPVHVENALVYYEALRAENISAEIHIFSEGGHGYGLRPTQLPVTQWASTAGLWLRTIHVLAE